MHVSVIRFTNDWHMLQVLPPNAKEVKVDPVSSRQDKNEGGGGRGVGKIHYPQVRRVAAGSKLVDEGNGWDSFLIREGGGEKDH